MPDGVCDRTKHHRLLRTKNARFLAANLLHVVAKKRLVVEPDARDNRKVCVDDVERVEAPAQADLQHRDVDASSSKRLQGHQRGELEVGQRHVAAGRVDGKRMAMFGRRLLLPETESSNVMQRNAAENMAVNTPIQVSAADIIKRAMLDVHRRLNDEGLRSRMLLQVHDELVLDVPKNELDAAQALLKECMEGAADLSVPLEVSMGYGRNWVDAH